MNKFKGCTSYKENDGAHGDSIMFLYETEKVATDTASGNVNGSSLNNRSSNGNYWSRTFHSSSNAWKLNFNSSDMNSNTNNRNNGFSVRGVRF